MTEQQSKPRCPLWVSDRPCGLDAGHKGLHVPIEWGESELTSDRHSHRDSIICGPGCPEWTRDRQASTSHYVGEAVQVCNAVNPDYPDQWCTLHVGHDKVDVNDGDDLGGAEIYDHADPKRGAYWNDPICGHPILVHGGSFFPDTTTPCFLPPGHEGDHQPPPPIHDALPSVTAVRGGIRFDRPDENEQFLIHKHGVREGCPSSCPAHGRTDVPHIDYSINVALPSSYRVETDPFREVKERLDGPQRNYIYGVDCPRCGQYDFADGRGHSKLGSPGELCLPDPVAEAEQIQSHPDEIVLPRDWNTSDLMQPGFSVRSGGPPQPGDVKVRYSPHNRDCPAFKDEARSCACPGRTMPPEICARRNADGSMLCIFEPHGDSRHSFEPIDPSDEDYIAPDMVNHPQHYGGDTVYETIKVLEAWGLATQEALLFNVVKYLSRAGKKGDHLEDMKKARFYLDRAITNAEKERS